MEILLKLEDYFITFDEIPIFNKLKEENVNKKNKKI